MGCNCSRNSAAHEEVNAPRQNHPAVQAPHHSDSSASGPGDSDADQLTSPSPDNTPRQNRSNARRRPSGASGPGGSDANQSTSLSPDNTPQQNRSNPEVHRRLPSGAPGPRDPDAHHSTSSLTNNTPQQHHLNHEAPQRLPFGAPSLRDAPDSTPQQNHLTPKAPRTPQQNHLTPKAPRRSTSGVPGPRDPGTGHSIPQLPDNAPQQNRSNSEVHQQSPPGASGLRDSDNGHSISQLPDDTPQQNHSSTKAPRRSSSGSPGLQDADANHSSPPLPDHTPQTNHLNTRALRRSPSSASDPRDADTNHSAPPLPDSTPQQNHHSTATALRRSDSGAPGLRDSDANHSTPPLLNNIPQQNHLNTKAARRSSSSARGSQDSGVNHSIPQLPDSVSRQNHSNTKALRRSPSGAPGPPDSDSNHPIPPLLSNTSRDHLLGPAVSKRSASGAPRGLDGSLISRLPANASQDLPAPNVSQRSASGAARDLNASLISRLPFNASQDRLPNANVSQRSASGVPRRLDESSISRLASNASRDRLPGVNVPHRSASGTLRGSDVNHLISKLPENARPDPVQELLSTIIVLCDKLPYNRNAASYLARRCQRLVSDLKDHSSTSEVSECLAYIKEVMHRWCRKSWDYMLLHQQAFEAESGSCDTRISNCRLSTIPSTVEEGDLKKHQEVDRRAVMQLFSTSNFVQRIKDATLTDIDQTKILRMMQGSLADCEILSDDERKRIAKNIYAILQVSGQLLPQHQLDSGEVEWSGNKGRFLHSEDVRMKVIRSSTMKDEGSIQRLKDEFKAWETLHKKDQGKHIMPYYGFSFESSRVALFIPLTNNGSALDYVKKNDTDVDYGKLILGIAQGIKVLHSIEPSIIHGNLRAKNVCVGNEGQPLITDFGLAKFDPPTSQSVASSDNCRWYAPEMFQQPEVSTEGDVYCFGMTILELLTHEAPFANMKKTHQVISRKREAGLPDRPRDKRVIDRGLDEKMWNLLCQCWSKDPKSRIKVERLVKKLHERGISPSHDPKKPSHLLWLTQLKAELIANNDSINENQLNLMRNLLGSPDYDAIVSVMSDPSDNLVDSSYAQLLIDFILQLLRGRSLSKFDISDAHKKARRLMFGLVSKTDEIPVSLSIRNIRILDVRGLGHLHGKKVMLRVIDKHLITKNFWRDALGWQSFAEHKYIHPLLGIFQSESESFLVSPFMSNGTITEWRRKAQDIDIAQIHTLMREVAKGVTYIHSEGLVHGNLCGETILLSPDFHCKISDFGLTRRVAADKKITESFHPNFAAPELFGMCATCAQPNCNGCNKGDMDGIKTMRADVYAYGCLYYGVFYDNIPFQGKKPPQIMSLVTGGKRPEQLATPRMKTDTWDTIQKCWEQIPSHRPSMQEIATSLS